MRLKSILLSLLLASQCLVAAPISQDDETVIEVITTLSGKTYHHCRIYKVDPDGVMFFHERGGCKVLFLDLPPEVCRRLGYDPQKQASYENDLSAKRAKRKEQAAALQRAYQAQLAMAQFNDLRESGYNGPFPYPDQSSLIAPGQLAYSVGWPLSAGFGNLSGLGYGGRGIGSSGGRAHARTVTSGVTNSSIPCNAPAVNIISRGGAVPCNTAPIYFGTPALGRLAPALGAPVPARAASARYTASQVRSAGSAAGSRR